MVERSYMLPDSGRQQLALELAGLLGDLFVFTMKMYNFHWNVTGDTFMLLHKMFEEDYKGARDLLDDVAERIRALGFSTPTTSIQLVNMASLKEQPGLLDWMAMVEETVSDHEKSADTMNRIANLADQLGDQATVDLLGAAALREDKRAWIFRSTLLVQPQLPVR